MKPLPKDTKIKMIINNKTDKTSSYLVNRAQRIYIRMTQVELEQNLQSMMLKDFEKTHFEVIFYAKYFLW